MKHSTRHLLALWLALTATATAWADDGVTTRQPADVSETKATLQATFASGSTANGFQYKYGTIPERTEFVNLAIAPTGDPLAFTQGSKAWRARTAMGWVESYYDTAASQLSSDLSTTFTLTTASTITFDWKVSSEENIGRLDFIVDGETVSSITGEPDDFVTVSHALTAGEHTLQWQYVRTAAENAGLGLGYLRNINVQNTTAGDWLSADATADDLQLTGLYPSQQYLFRAFSTVGGSTVYSDIKQFETATVSIDQPVVTDTTQATATVSGSFHAGDAEVETGIVLNPLNSFDHAALAKESDPITFTATNWSAGTGNVKSSRSAASLTTTVILTEASTITFDWTVSGYYTSSALYASRRARILFNVDGEMKSSIACLGYNGNSASVSVSLSAGTHTLEWQTYSYSNITATLSNVNIQHVDLTNSNVEKLLPLTGDGSAINTVLTSLKPNTTYGISTYMKPTFTSALENKWPIERSAITTFTTLPVTADTAAMANLRQASVTLHGVAVAGDATIAAKGLQYRVATGTRWSNATTSATGDSLSANVRNLRPSTEYQYRAYIQAEDCDTVFSPIASFTTEAVVAHTPVVLSSTQRSATVSGKLVAGDAVIYTRGIQFRKSTSATWEDTEDVGTADSITLSKDNLDIDTEYQTRTYIQPAGCDTIYSSVLTFRTKTVEIFIDSITNVYQHSATVYGHIDSGSEPVDQATLSVISSYAQSPIATFEMTLTGNEFRQEVTGLSPERVYIIEARVSFGNGQSSVNVEKATCTTIGYLKDRTPVESTVSNTKATLSFKLNPTLDENVTYKFRLTSDDDYMRETLSTEAYEAYMAGQTATGQVTDSIVTFNFDNLFPCAWHSCELTVESNGNTYDGGYLPGFSTKSYVIIYEEEPWMNGGQVSDITQTSVKLTNRFSDPLDDTISSAGYKYWPAEGGDTLDVSAVVSDSLMTATVNGLLPNKKYYFAYYVTVKGVTYYPQNYVFKWNYQSASFTTLPVGLDISMNEVAQTYAVAHIEVDNGEANISNLRCDVDGEDRPIAADGSIRIDGLRPDYSYTLSFYYQVDGEYYSYFYPFQTKAVTATAQVAEVCQTAVLLNVNLDWGTATVTETGILVNGEKRAVETADSWTVDSLLPASSYTLQPYVVTEEGGTVFGNSLKASTKAISLATLRPTNISNRSATLNGTILCDELSGAEFGFQWKEKTGWTTDPRFTKGRKMDDGSITVSLTNGMLKPDTEYEYRTVVHYQDRFYTADEWDDLRTELEYVFYAATPYTVYRTDSENNRLVLCGYYVAGSEDVLEQGYEYWQETAGANAPRRAPADVTRVLTDSTMVGEIDLSTLAEGYYSVRAFVTTTSGTVYGDVQQFTVGNPTDVPTAISAATAADGLTEVYDLQGRKVAGASSATVARPAKAGVYVVRTSDGRTLKVGVK